VDIPARPEDFDAYVAAAWQRLLRSAWVLTHDWYLAEDLLQTALLKVAPKWHMIAAGAPDAYVRKALATTYLSWWRRRWRGEVPTAQPPERPAGEDPMDAVGVRTALTQALAALPRQQRAVLMLRYHADLTESATAAALGISIGAVKSHASRAIAALRAQPGIRGLLVEEESHDRQ
jgi:RNA polymerase sigma-70 factor (sigma-E family)